MKHNAGVEAEITRRLFMETIIHKIISVSKPPLLPSLPSKSLPRRQSHLESVKQPAVCLLVRP